MGLLKNAVILGALVALMPTDRAQQAKLAEQAFGAAKWTYTFCERNAATCLQAADAWIIFKKKAEFAGQLAYDLIQERLNNVTADPSAPPPAASGRTVPAERAPAVERGTLTPQDLKPSWRGAAPKQGA